jgi:uncharacterized phage protein gp47/JayE
VTNTYDRPSYQDLKARIEADLAAMPDVLRVPLAACWARACNGIHGHLDWLDLQNSPLTCDLDRLYDWAELYGVPRLLATASVGTATATGNTGAMLLAGTLARGINNFNYSALGAVTLIAGVATVSLRCETTGAAGNLTSGQLLTLVDPVSGVSSTLTVDSAGLTGGSDDELAEDWRLRVIDQWQTMTTDGARGGKPADYKFWAKTAHPSVTDALVFNHAQGMGTVVVKPICDALTSRLPSAAVLQTVTTALSALAPMTAEVYVSAPTPRVVSFNLHLSAVVDTAPNRAAIEQALRSLILAETSEQAVLLLAEIDSAVSSVTTQYTRQAPTADTVCAAGEILVFGAVNWV